MAAIPRLNLKKNGAAGLQPSGSEKSPLTFPSQRNTS